MDRFVKFVIHSVALLFFTTMDATLAWLLLESTFNLGYGTWWGIAAVGIAVARSGALVQELWKDLTK